MSIDEETGEITFDTLGGGARLWRVADKMGIIERIKEFFRKPRTIVVLGATGSGKTNLLKSLSVAPGLISAIHRDARTEHVEKSRIKIGNQQFLAIDTPGQMAHKYLREEAIRESLAKRPLLVINVVSYGFHEYTYPPITDAVDEEGNPRQEYLERHRINELAALDEWLPLLGHREMTKLLVTAVTKADLWWNDKEIAKEYYANEPYGKLVRAADQGLHHVVLPYCSVVHRFFNTSLLPGTFDDAVRQSLNLQFLTQLSKLVS